jgi:hypothetical protein
MILPASVTTLDEFRISGRTITAFCTNYWVCSHDGQLRLEVLALHLGWQFDFFQGRLYLASRLYCSLCGTYHPAFSLGHAGKPSGYAGTHSAGFTPLPPEESARLQLARQAAAKDDLPWVGIRKGGRKFGR